MKEQIKVKNSWNINSWESFTVKQSANYNDSFLQKYKKILKNTSPIVSYKSVIDLKNSIANIENNNGFILQIGECAEEFSQSNTKDVAQRLLLINEFSHKIQNKNIIKIGRIAGQYAKPRSEELEFVNNVSINTYRGDLINNYNVNYRQSKASRLSKAYKNAKKTYSIIKHLKADVFTSHEALVLEYEASLTKFIKEKNKYYSSSAHMLWLGDKTRFINSAHVEYLRGIDNPIGIKVSEKSSPEDVINIVKTLNPSNEKGKIILINRMGVANTSLHLPRYIEAFLKNGLNVVWTIDPMHGNSYKISNSINTFKTRNINDIMKEIEDFAFILAKLNVYWGGIHIEATPLDVLECVENKQTQEIDATINKMQSQYLSYCDPRLNAKQSLEIAELINSIK